MARRSDSNDLPPAAPGGSGNETPRGSKYLVLLRNANEETVSHAVSVLQDRTGMKEVFRASATAGAYSRRTAGADRSGLGVYQSLGVLTFDGEPGQIDSACSVAEADDAILAIAPQQRLYALGNRALGWCYPGNPWWPQCLEESAVSGASGAAYQPEWFFGGPWNPYGAAPGAEGHGCRNAAAGYDPAAAAASLAATHAYGMEMLAQAVATGALMPPTTRDVREATWGLNVTGVTRSSHTGQGVRVAVLDTGVDLTHPDLRHRIAETASFIPGEDVQDGNGHGTHCAGTIGGPAEPETGPRYGCAPECELFIGKVLSNAGSGWDEEIIAGIEWALQKRCDVISMSLGSPPIPNDPRLKFYESIGRRALLQGSLIVAAAGNASQRPWHLAPVGLPAAARSIMAVAAVDSLLRVAPFSCAASNEPGGEIDIAGPGVSIYSSWLEPELYAYLSGTSMAAPHVAGIAALHLREDLRGRKLWNALTRSARRLPAPRRDVGAGLVQAPTS